MGFGFTSFSCSPRMLVTTLLKNGRQRKKQGHFAAPVMTPESTDPSVDELTSQVHHKLVEKLAKENERLEGFKSQLTENTKALQERYRIQEFLTEVSSELMMRASTETDEALEEALGKLGKFTGADRAVIIVLSEETECMDCTHEWCGDEILSNKEVLQNLPLDTFPWWMEKVQRFEQIYVSKLDSLPPFAIKERKLLETLQVKSAVALPMGEQGKFVGFVGLSWIRSAISFDKTLIPNLQLAGNILFGAMHRANAEKDHLRHLKTEAASEAKSNFLARMSHELRTPLNAIIGYSEMLTEDAEEAGLQDFESDLSKITGSGKFLLEMINDILDLSKVEVGKMEVCLETFELNEVVNEVKDVLTPLAEKNNNVLEVESLYPDGMKITSDRIKLRQILINLLSNSAKFTTEGTIKLKIADQEVNSRPSLVFSVKDNGIGMSEEQIQKIFNPFDQAESTTGKDYGGTGLGLAITKSFVEMMRGTIEVESKVKWGSHFKVTLPSEPKDETLVVDDWSASPGTM
jgi:signal transduction histidine kinase